YLAGDPSGASSEATVTLHVAPLPPPPADVQFTLQLTQPDGSPLTGLAAGQNFVLHVSLQDASSDPHGVIAAYLDIAWDATKAVATGPLHYGQSYPNFHATKTALPGFI